MVIKERIAQLRKVKQMSREDLAEAAGVHINIIGRYEVTRREAVFRSFN